MRVRLLLLALLVPLAAFVPSRADASRFIELSLNQMIRGASAIVEGDVVGVTGAWTPDRTRIYTTVTLQLRAVHKGSIAVGTMNLRLLGGTVNEITMAVIGQPQFAAGERVFLFLDPGFESGEVPVLGGQQGKLVVVSGAGGADVLLGSQQTFEKSDVTRDIRSVMRPIGQ